jgi:hypothetical protein
MATNLSRFSGTTTAQAETLETRVKGRGLCIGEREIATDRETARASGRGGWATAAADGSADVGRPAATWGGAGRERPAAAWCGAA